MTPHTAWTELTSLPPFIASAIRVLGVGAHPCQGPAGVQVLNLTRTEGLIRDRSWRQNTNSLLTGT